MTHCKTCQPTALTAERLAALLKVNARPGPAGSRFVTRPLGCRTKTAYAAQEAAITSAEAIPAYVDGFLPEDEPLLTARSNAAEVGGATAVRPVTGAALRFVACAIGARAVVEIGTG